MNFKRILIVYRKEMMEMLRDKRTIFSTIVLPFVLYPVLFIGFASLMSRQQEKLEERGASLAIMDSVRNEASQIIVSELRKIEYFTYLPYSPVTDSLYAAKSIHGIITIRDSLQQSGIPQNIITVKLDKSTDRGKMMIDKIRQALKDSEEELLKQRLAEKGISAEFMSVVNVREQDTSTPTRKLGSILGAILPYLLIMLLIAGASVVASDLVAGEKERRTLETLMVSAAHRNEIVIGKYFTIITFALINVSVNLFSLYFSMRNLVGRGGIALEGVSFPFSSFLIFFLALIPLATLYAAVLLSVSTFSRNMKEARSYEQPILLVSMLLAAISIFPAIELNTGMALIPVINVALLFKALMIGEYNLLHLFLTIGSTVLLDIIAIIMTIKLFNNEAVLFRSDADTSLKYARRKRKVFFTPFYGMLYFSLALLALYYIGSKLQAQDLARGLIQTQIFIILLPVLLVLRMTKANLKDTLRLKPTKASNFLIVPFITVSGAVIVTLISQLINLVYPFPPEYLEQLSGLVTMPGLELWQVFLVIAVLPGICEEVLFRGFIFRFFDHQGKWKAIIISALLFAFFHLDPYRFVPVLLLGILLGWLMVKSRSLYTSMYSHALNNALALSLIHFGHIGFIRKIVVSNDGFNWWLGIPAAAVLVISLHIFNKINKEENSSLEFSGN